MIFNSSDNNMVPNFNIVGGTTKPTIQTDNTIWINTEYSITGYAISEEQPSEAYDGMIWIKTGTTDVYKFSVFEHNTLIACPSTAFQYRNERWTSVTAIRYNADGSYDRWGDGIIFDNDYTDRTWTITPESKSYEKPAFGLTTSDGANILCIGNVLNESTKGTVLTTDVIDLSDRDTLTVTISKVGNSYGASATLYVGVWPAISGSSSDMVAGTSAHFSSSSSVPRVKTVNVADLDGLYHIGFYFSYSPTNGSSAYAYVSEIALS